MVKLLVTLFFAPFGVSIIKHDTNVTLRVAIAAYAVMAILALLVAWV